METVDFADVEILSAGGPVHGVGSPPEGDFYTPDDIRRIAAAHRDLGDEIKPPAKIGHSDKQQLLGVTEGEIPAVGWLTNVRASSDGRKLLADVKRVPRRVASLVQAGAYRTRSVELSRVTSQKTGQVYDWVVTGLAWLGGKLPAVQTLDDVVALYEGPAAVQRVRVVDTGALARAHAVTEGCRDVARRVDRFCARPLIDAAVADGRIGRDERELWSRLFEADFDSAKRLLSNRPRDSRQAAVNAMPAWTPDREAAYQAHARNLGLAGAEIV